MTKHFGSEEGAVLIIVTAFMVAAIALVTLVIDVGHWFEHKRHLQGQVDAGALAGGGHFNGSVAGSLPRAVRDVNPLDVGAILVNEGASNAVLGRQDLVAGANQLLNGVNVTPWTGGPVSVSVPTGASRIGVVIASCSNPAIC